MRITVIPKEDVLPIMVVSINGGSQSVQFVLNDWGKRDEIPKELQLEGDDRVWKLHGVFGRNHFEARTWSLAVMVNKLGPDKTPLMVANGFLLLATSVAVFEAPRLTVEA